MGALVAALMVLLAPSRTAASTVAECRAAIRTLTQHTEQVLFARGDQGLKLQSQLLRYLSKASGDLDRSDLQDALKQLDDFTATVSRAVSSGKVSSENAAVLQEGANDAIACINGIAL